MLRSPASAPTTRRQDRDTATPVIGRVGFPRLHGGAGFGTSCAVNAPLRELAPDNTLRVVFHSRPIPRDIRHPPVHGLHLPGHPPGRPTEVDVLLTGALAGRFRILVRDEAQWTGRECFEYWRRLGDGRETRIAVLFVGGGYRVLRREPMLASRIFWVLSRIGGGR